MNIWLALALGAIQFVNALMSRLSEDEKRAVLTKLIEADNMGADLQAIARAKAVARDVFKALNDEAKIMEADKDMRP